jgi:hypothetical protein
MRTLFLALVLSGTWALTAAHSQPRQPIEQAPLTFEDGFKVTWAERTGPQFLFAWSEDDIVTVRRALAKLEDEHLRDPQGIDNYLMGRQTRILKKLEHPGFFRYGMYWDIDLVDVQGKKWRLQPMSTPETVLTGFAVSRDRYCRAEDQDVDDLGFLEAGVECYIRNTAAIELFDRIAATRHETPGGAAR